ncbi:hypothetical protein [Planomonospora sp. ID82291]|uniref:hypothetical protein n=1 Tax=Planomonospora sp. ID82291 TaxID=2738136 RepID=UPI0018C42D48|nr:hypothetical protein [Planomonospora sp. ID82291]MBG0819043.1 hypothetical protein [Planomonospora sp. ID82291]
MTDTHSSGCVHEIAVPLEGTAGPEAVVCLCGARWTSRAQVPEDVAFRLDVRLGAGAWESREPSAAARPPAPTTDRQSA